MKTIKTIPTFTVMLMISLIAGSTFASDNWQHVRLRSLDDTAISVDFLTQRSTSNSNKPSSTVYATPLYFNVLKPNLTSKDKVRVVLLAYAQSKGYGYDSEIQQRQYTVDLAYTQEGRFTGQLNKKQEYPDEFANSLPIQGEYYGGINYYWQELAIVINGKWLLDPYSKTHNFQFSLANVR